MGSGGVCSDFRIFGLGFRVVGDFINRVRRKKMFDREAMSLFFGMSF